MQPSREQAKEIFERVRDIPYRLAEFLGDAAPQCAYKSYILIKELAALGYEVRTRIAEMDWHQTLFPENIVCLHPRDITPTHMYVEICENGIWRALDASWDQGLRDAGFPIAEFDGLNSPGLNLARIYEPQEAEEYLKSWSDPKKAKEYFEAAAEFLRAANQWLLEIRTS